jgi:pilus assembly protein Flp/PilA
MERYHSGDVAASLGTKLPRRKHGARHLKCSAETGVVIMKRFHECTGKLQTDRAGVTALEYGIIASILGLVLVTIFTSFGSTLTSLFSSVSTSI